MNIFKGTFFKLTSNGLARKETGSNDAPAIQKAINYCLSGVRKLLIPAGNYFCLQEIIADGIRGIEGEGIEETVLTAGANISAVIRVENTSRTNIQNFTVDGNGLADICISTNYNTQVGPSLNNNYSGILVRNYKKYGWDAINNNDCWFTKITIIEPAGTTFIGAIRAYGPGGPCQFSDCNFTGGETHISAQYISFLNCVFGGIVVDEVGYNNIDVVGSYLFCSPRTGNVIEIANIHDTSTPTEAGPINFLGTHIEMISGGYLIGGVGKLHNGINAIGCHIFSPGLHLQKPKIVSDSVISQWFPSCVNKFSNCRFENIEINGVTGAFRNSFENCNQDSFQFSDFTIENGTNTLSFSQNLKVNGNQVFTNKGGTITGKVGILAVNPVSRFANTEANITDFNNFGVNPESIAWRINNLGYIAAFDNQNSSELGNGILIKSATLNQAASLLKVMNGNGDAFTVTGGGNAVFAGTVEGAPATEQNHFITLDQLDQKKGLAVSDLATSPSAAYVQGEAQNIITELRALKESLINAALLSGSSS